MQRLFTKMIRKPVFAKLTTPVTLPSTSLLPSRSFATFFGQPLDSKPQWVDNRGLQAVCQVHRLDQNFLDSLSDSFTLVDAGCGKAEFLEQVRKKYPKAKLIGATATAIESKKQDAIDEIHYGLLPHSRTLFNHHAGEIDWVMDTMGVITYGDNPIHMLIALCSLLKEGGKISSVSVGNENNSRFGTLRTREKLQKFLAELGMDVQFDFYQKPSIVKRCGLLDVTILKVSAKQNGAFIADNLDLIFQKADRMVGTPKEINNENCRFFSPDHFPTKGYGSILYEDSPDMIPNFENTIQTTAKMRL